MENNNQPAARTSHLQGILMIVTALSIAAFSGAIMKMLADHISPQQVAWFRFTGMSLILLPYLIWRYGIFGLNPARPWIQLIRGLTMAGGTTAFVIGAQTVDYADAIAILYAYPFLLVIIAVLFLGEHANWSVWIGVVGGFIGVLMVMRPEFDQVNTGTFYIFACAVIVAVQMALNRKLSIVSPPLVTAFAGATCAAIALSLTLPGSWQAIPDESWWLIGLLVVSGAINQTMLVFAFTHAGASTLAPFTYFEIVSAVIFGFLFFGTLPSLLSWGGIALITAGGIYVARALHVRNIPRRVPKI
ncbi:MAG: DMT family transporter [Gammaproteobacteria bacterium]|nr:MAG: DMT family transporter [Gammaproteobacteria bacterium]